ncbi:MAG: LysM peptidoglycan-binding domain-containing protein, partial [Woeseiaceae bacterium]
MRGPRSCAVLLIAVGGLLLAACGPKTRWDHTPRDEHIVRRGETLFAIAWRYGKDPAELARWNSLEDPSLIHPGQLIRLTPPPGMPAAASSAPGRRPQPLPPIPTDPSPDWRWPASGSIDVAFGRRPGTGTGVLIGGTLGEPVLAAAGGRVVYAGGGLIG